MTPYRTKRGETLVIPLEAIGAADDDLAGITISAGLKRAVSSQFVPAASTLRTQTFATDPRAAEGQVGPGWNLSLTAEQTLQLEPGLYCTDAVLTLPGGSAVEITEPLFVKIEQAVSV